MRTFLVAFALSFVAGLAAVWMARELALRWKLVDAPTGGRNIHTRPIPRFGGVGVAVAFFLPLLGLAIYSNDISTALFADTPLLIGLLGGGSVILAAGLWDDLADAPAIAKLGAQVLAGLIIYFAGLHIEVFTVPFVGMVELGWLSLPLTVFWVVLVTNALNLIDGMDGLAGGVAVLAGGTLFVMSVVEGNVLSSLLLAAMVGATLAFLVFNFNPATIFLGDTGSLFLGFLLALTSVHGSQKSYTLFSIVAAFMALGLPIFDLAMAVVRRGLTGKPLFSADQHHIHHQLLRRGLNQRQSVGLLFVAAGTLGALGLVFVYSTDRWSAVTLFALATMVGLAVHFLGYGKIIRAGRQRLLLGNMEQDARDRSVKIRELRKQLSAQPDLPTLWATLQQAGDTLNLEVLDLDVSIDGEGGHEQHRYSWLRPGAVVQDDGVHIDGLETVPFPIELAGLSFGVLRLTWLREHVAFHPHQVALGRILADSVAHALCAQRGLTHMNFTPAGAEQAG